jgi:hypothetical protein
MRGRIEAGGGQNLGNFVQTQKKLKIPVDNVCASAYLLINKVRESARSRWNPRRKTMSAKMTNKMLVLTYNDYREYDAAGNCSHG